jgi:hypothetical protein
MKPIFLTNEILSSIDLMLYSIPIDIYCFDFWWYWSFNSRPHTCWAGPLPLEPLLQSCVGYFPEWVFGTICWGLALNCDPPDLCHLGN